MLVSILRRQVFRRNFVKIVAAIIGGMGAKQAAAAPEVYGRHHDGVAGGYILRGQKPQGEQARTPIGEAIDRAQSAYPRRRPRRGHDSLRSSPRMSSAMRHARFSQIPIRSTSPTLTSLVRRSYGIKGEAHGQESTVRGLRMPIGHSIRLSWLPTARRRT